MKRILLLIALLSGSIAPQAGAQSLSSLLKSLFGTPAAEQSAAPEAPAAPTAAELLGTWYYNKAAVTYSGNDLLASLAVAALEEPIAGYGAKAGLVAGRDRLVFGTRGRLTAQVDKTKKEGSYTYDPATGSLTLRIAIGDSVGELTGRATLEKGQLTLLFDAQEALAAMDSAAPKLRQNEQVQFAASIVAAYPGIQLGGVLKR